jgi:hypothetical protein
MNAIRRLLICLVILAIQFSATFSSFAQTKGNKEVVRELRELEDFNKIEVGGAFDVFITQGDQLSVEVETDENIQPKVKTVVKDQTLIISSKGIYNPTKLNVYISLTEIEAIYASGACDIESDGILKAEMLEINTSGASDVKLELEVENLRTDASGASTVILSGQANQHSLEASGASDVKARKLITQSTSANLSGASTAKVYAVDDLIGEVSGSADLDYSGSPGEQEVYRKSSVTTTKNYRSSEDTTRVNIAGVDIEVIEGDSVKVRIGNNEIKVDDGGNVKINKRYKKRKYNGHWAGFDIGLNGYVTPDFNMKFKPEDEYLDLRMEKSVVVNINFFEQNVPISRNHKFGATTGLGLNLPNYRFRRATHLSPDSSALIGYISDGISVRKTKLSAMYLTLPVLFEWQTNGRCKKNSFHVGAGVIVGARLMSWTKVYYNEQNKEFTLNKYNPETGEYEAAFTSISPGYQKVKDRDDWFLRPFKFDATLRIGWGIINLWATYSFNSMFRDGRGPEVYPWSAGITLLNL